MENLYLSKTARKAIEKAMPAKIRKLYKAGNFVVDVTIVRRNMLYRYGKQIKLEIEKNGKYVISDMEDTETREDIAKNIVEYFVYGDKGTAKDWETVGYKNGLRVKVIEKYVVGGDYAIII